MHSTGKKIGIILAAIAGFTIVMGLTILALNFFNKPKENTAQTTPQSNFVVSTIDAFATTPPEALKGMDMLRLQPAELSVTAKPEGASFNILVPSSGAVSFTSKQLDTVADIDTILSQSKTKFTEMGFVQQTEKELSVSYRNATTLCQVDVQKQYVAVVSYACIEDGQTANEYKAIKSLVTLYNNKAADDKKIKEPVQISRSVLQRDAVTGATLSVQGPVVDEKPTGGVYLFGAIDGSWEYVADLSSGESSGKTNVPAENLAATNDPKWNGVLAELIGLNK